ncbi:alpha/beta hydrolase domain-containing protein [Thermomonospora amylolytica]|uniref:alpha/beta hydrolase domain-containing protein n=1 Tax=Thermomonospora amylolytica TaxID=1411117 RepID=UPI001F330812|nr:alpha/beta hydrolase domain-containing protein [Thermomonospora amylolytica]
MPRLLRLSAFLPVVVAAGLLAAPSPATAEPVPVDVPAVQGPIPGTVPGDPKAPEVGDTYPWMSTDVDLASAGYVEQEFYVSGKADAYSLTGEQIAADVPYRTRMIVRRPANPLKFNGTVLAEWQNVSAGYDIDALWNHEQLMREGYAWVGISAQRVGVNHLRTWSPARYGQLDVTGGGQFNADELSYDIYAQAAKALRATSGVRPLGLLKPRTLLGIGASQSSVRMTVYYDRILPKTEAVFDGYGHIVGTAPSRKGAEPVFHVQSETDVRTPTRRPDDDKYRRWEVAGTAHSGWNGQAYRKSILDRDLGAAPTYNCARPPFSRAPLHHVLAAAYGHLTKWVQYGVQPPSAQPLEFNADGTMARDEHGLARGGIRLSQVEVPTALNDGINSGETFCVLFGTHIPFDEAKLDALYPSHTRYVAAVAAADTHNVRSGYLLPGDARQNLLDASRSDIGKD